MHSFYSSLVAARVRWLDLPALGTPVVFIHGLGCASSREYSRLLPIRHLAAVASLLPSGVQALAEILAGIFCN